MTVRRMVLKGPNHRIYNMHLTVRRYKKHQDRVSLYTFKDAEGAERAYILVEDLEDKDLKVETLDAKGAADSITHKLGLGGFTPDGPEEVVDQWSVSSTADLGESPNGPAVDPFDMDGGSDYRTFDPD